MTTLQEQYDAIKAKKLNLNMKRGQPANENFALSHHLLTIVDGEDVVTPSGIDVRNYPGGVAGLPQARELFGRIIGTSAAETIVGNNSSLEMMANMLQWALLRGVFGSESSWVTQSPKMIVTIPGYDRHFKLLLGIGYELVTVDITSEGPDMDAVEQIAASDPSVKGIFFVPVYSNPTGDTISAETAHRLATMSTAAPDFTVFADNAYVTHHLVDNPDPAPNLLDACKAAGNPNRVILYGSTSKITFASGGIGYIGMSEANVAHWSKWFGLQSIGPNKVEQWRHVKFLKAYPDGVDGLMRDHRCILQPKFEAVDRVLSGQLGDSGLATWTKPQGGYFISLDTKYPVADRVVALAAETGVALTPAGAPYPHGIDPHNRNIRLAPSRPPLAEVEMAMEVVALCIRLASAEYTA